MSKKNILQSTIIVLLAFSLVSSLVLLAEAQPPMPPCWFYGIVNVEGLPAQENLNVTATIEGTNLAWTTKTKNGTYGWTQRGSSTFYVPSDNLTTPEKDGGVDGDIIEFYVNGTLTNQTAIFESMSLKRADLTVVSIPGDNGHNEGNGSPLNPYVPYAALAIVIGIGFATVLWIHRKGYSIKVLRKPN